MEANKNSSAKTAANNRYTKKRKAGALNGISRTENIYHERYI